MKRSISGGLTAVATFFLMSPALAQDLPEVTLQAVAGSLGGVPMMIIEGENLDEKYGFDGTFEYLPHEGIFQNFLIGNADVSMDNDLLGVAYAREEGFDITSFYPVGNLYLGIVVPGSSDAETPEDLKGKKVGHFGADSGTTMFIRLIVEEMYGFDVLEDYEMSQVGPAALVSLLKEGEVDAIFDFESFVSEAIVATDGRYLLQAYSDYSEFTGGFSPWITNMVAKEEWLKENPELAYGVRDAYDEAIALLDETNYEILRKPYIREKLGITSDAVLDALIANGAAHDYFTNDWSEEKRSAALDFLEKLAEDGEVLQNVPDGMMVALEDYVGPRS
ncbi:ABC transporter substrate-binding protein [Celeribacter indicus]|uniref:ABC-type nitrate/sulfonate/bicarbonate transport system, substrate binding protein n=1 Tax=Celeribacter indicus TaxID=1208324 RepID=A0A0B5DYU8_9RHOB|nr:ABC transporter substrate-binding protein [Celeribacter indicus]AJE48603.1 ABC-type nitrate/sulfonate/bicarbonate transport system, substrate binding protein [Celeribacter indicus]SDX09497.1 NitT/TauT family transport system substrate-binding protein [Celeribacter indicus]